MEGLMFGIISVHSQYTTRQLCPH